MRRGQPMMIEPDRPVLGEKQNVPMPLDDVADDDVDGIGRAGNDRRKETLNSILQMFPNADPKWVADKLDEMSGDALVERMVDQPGSYDKMKTKQEKTLITVRREDLLDRSTFDPSQFLAVYPDPKNHFTALSVDPPGFLYMDHALVALKNDFKTLRIDFLKQRLNTNIWAHKNLYTTYRELQQFIVNNDNKNPVFMKTSRKRVYEWPVTIDEAFFRELQFARWEEDINEYKLGLKDARERKISAARQQNALKECGCCIMEDCLPDEMVVCGNKHAFCNDCVQGMVESKLGEGCHKIPCLSSGCNENYDPVVLRHVLKAATFDRLIRNMQQYELKEANIADLCMCPFCDFAIVIDNPYEKLFACLNPDCLKVSCRSCKELSHIPLRCDEVEKDEDVRMRTYLEEECAKALIRHCPTCQNPLDCRIVKESGCNRMVCTRCSTYFCYQCCKELSKKNPYGHFVDGAGAGGRSDPARSQTCKVNTSVKELHADVALKAGTEAREKYLKDHPEMKGRIGDLDVKGLVDEDQQAIGAELMQQAQQNAHQLVRDNQGHQWLIVEGRRHYVNRVDMEPARNQPAAHGLPLPDQQIMQQMMGPAHQHIPAPRQGHQRVRERQHMQQQDMQIHHPLPPREWYQERQRLHQANRVEQARQRRVQQRQPMQQDIERDGQGIQAPQQANEEHQPVQPAIEHNEQGIDQPLAQRQQHAMEQAQQPQQAHPFWFPLNRIANHFHRFA